MNLESRLLEIGLSVLGDTSPGSPMAVELDSLQQIEIRAKIHLVDPGLATKMVAVAEFATLSDLLKQLQK